MKRINVALVTVFTLILGFTLSACGFKEPSATFSESEVYISTTDTLNLYDYLSTSEFSKEEAEFKFSNSSFFDFENGIISPKTYGQTVVYVRHGGNTLDDMRVVVKKPYEQVENIKMDDNGVVTWSKVVDKFDETQDFSSPKSYKVNYIFKNPDTNESRDVEEIVNGTEFTLLDEGRYTFKVTAVGEGYFDNSVASEVTLYFGYMPKLQKTDFSFKKEDNVLSWAQVSTAYSVILNDETIVEETMENSINLSPYLENAGRYSVEILVMDSNNEKISTLSEEIFVDRIDNAELTYSYSAENGGVYNVSLGENALKAVVTVGEKTFEFEEDSETIFEGVSGINQIEVETISKDSEEDGVFMANSAKEVLGQIYKLSKVSLNGLGENKVDGDTFNLEISREESEVATSLHIKVDDDIIESSGFENGETTKNIQLSSITSGAHKVSVMQLAKESYFQNGESYNVVNSDFGVDFSFTKLANFEEFENGEVIKHAYLEEKSVLSFNLVDGAIDYELYVKTDEETLVDSTLFTRDGGTITFKGKIEEILSDFFVEGKITFVIVAKGDDKTTIFSSATKILTQLALIESSSGNKESEVYSWDDVQGASGYKVKYEIIDKEEYEDSENFTPSSLSEQTVAENKITLESGNYFYIEISAIPENESEYLTSKPFKTFFYLSKKLETPNVEVMYGILGEEIEKSYYIRVQKTENMESMSVSFNNSPLTPYKTENEVIFYKLNYNFNEEFNGVKLSVVAHSKDSQILLDSLPFEVNIKRHKQIQYDELIFDEFTKTMTVKGDREGVSKIVVSHNDKVVSTENEDAIFDISEIENGEVTVELKGSVCVEDVLSPIGNTIYLDSNVATFQLKRVDRPTDFTYNNGNLTFTATHLQANTFVLDIILEDVNNSKNLIKISNLTESGNPKISAYKINGEVYEEILAQEDMESVFSASNNNYTIDLDAVISQINSSSLSDLYFQATKIQFGIYVSSNSLNGGVVYLNSRYGTTLNDPSKEFLEIEKLGDIAISYDKENNLISWNSVGNATEYVVYEESLGVLSTIKTNSYNIDLSSLTLSKDYTFYVTAKSPYYLESSKSNEILIHRIDAVNSLTLSNNNLQFAPNINDSQYVTSATYKIDAGEENSVEKAVNFSLPISSSGKYTFKFVGTTEFEKDGKFYLDSEKKSFNVEEISSIAPEVDEIKYENSALSFTDFNKGYNFQNIRYHILFKNVLDETNYVIIETNETSFTISLDDENLINLKEGEINVSVFVEFETYSVSSGGTVYYARQNDELNLYNVYKYTDTLSLYKLLSPSIENVEFDSLSNSSTTPKMVIYFSGNYKDTESFNIFVNGGTILKTVSYSSAYVSDGNFKIELSFEEYINRMQTGINEISIVVTSSVNIPSKEGFVEIYMNDTLKSVYLNDDEDGFGHILELEFKNSENLNYATGGIDVVVTYTINGEEEMSETISLPLSSFKVNGALISYDLSSFFIEKGFDKGGSVSFSAYVRSYSNSADKGYFLASQPQNSQPYEVLTSPNEDKGLTKTNGGITVVSEENFINSQNTNYIITYGQESYIIGQNENFFFEFPSTWANGEYSLGIQAFENGKVKSTKKVFTINLSRLQWNENPLITLYRDENEKNIFKFNEVPNANSYIIRAYIEEELINEIEIIKNTNFTDIPIFSSEDIFGENYSLLQTAGHTILGANIRFDIIACNSLDATYTNSAIYSINTTLLGTEPNLMGGTIMASEDGFITFNGVMGETYLFTITSSQETNLAKWQEIVANSNGELRINLSNFENLDDDTIFSLRIKKKGDATDEGVVYNTSGNTSLILDSAFIESSRFKVSYKVQDIDFDAVDKSKITISLTNENSQIYVSQNDVYLGDLSLENAVKIDFKETGTQVGTNFVFEIDYTTLIDNFTFEEGQNTLYFYALQENNFGDYINTLSFKYEFSFEIGVEEIIAVEKMKETQIDFEEDGLDRAKTQIGFSLSDEIVGFYFNVDITLADGTEYNSLKYIYNQQDFIIDGDKIYLDLTPLFEDKTLFENLENKDINLSAGKYKLKVSVLKQNASGGVVFSNYIESFNGQELIFTKLPQLNNVYLANGDLYWEVAPNLTDFTSLADSFYIYLVGVGENGSTSKYRVDSTSLTYKGDLFSANYNQYEVYVKAVASSPYIIASSDKYIQDASGEYKIVTKNHFYSELSVDGSGLLSINWQATEGGTADNDIYSLLSITSSNLTSANAEALVNNLFFYPFTFTLYDLVNNNVNVRLRFTSFEGDNVKSTETVTINVMYLLQKLDIVDFAEKLDILANRLSLSQDRVLVTTFKENIQKMCGGIGGEINIFDEFFERIQSGKYQIEYCLLGNSSTFSSDWKTLKRGENVEDTFFYVNQTPKVSADKRDLTIEEQVLTEGIGRVFFLRIKPTKIYQNGELIDATRYVLRLKNALYKYGFEIEKIGGQWLCKRMGDEGVSFNLSTDTNGDIILYLNLNGKDSLKSNSAEILSSSDFDFEIFAVGNETSLSSKSELFELSYNGVCHDIHIENGTFVWQAHNNYPTRVVYKLSTSLVEEDETLSEVIANTQTFLPNASGDYDYIKFITMGDIQGNKIIVDSETYVIENIYKLAKPTLGTDFNMLRILEADDNITGYKQAFSEDSFKKYEIYNDNSSDLTFKFIELNFDKNVAYYEAGSTFYSSTSQDYAYKQTESSATNFSVSTLGSTANFAVEEKIDNEQKDYDVYLLKIDNVNATDISKILLRSEQSTLNAKMLNSIKKETVSIQDGIVTWSSDGILDENESLNLAYKVTLSFYEISIGSDGSTVTDSVDKDSNIVRYTQKTSFDISKVASEEIFPQSYDFIRITIQAMAVKYSSSIPQTDFQIAELVEGGYIYDDGVTYRNGTRVLMSNGVYLENIKLSQKVENVQIVDNHLTWTWNGSDEVIFIVEDENGIVIEGELSSIGNVYTFVEKAGKLSAGEHTLTIFAVETEFDGSIKSVGVEIDNIIKIADIKTEDYVVGIKNLPPKELPSGEILNVSVEVIDFSSYFEKNTYEGVEIEIRLTSGQEEIYINKEMPEFVVFATEEERDEFLVNFQEYRTFVIGKEIDFEVEIVGESETKYLLNSDPSSLHFERPEFAPKISYDETNGYFSWNTQEDLLFAIKIKYENESGARTYYNVTGNNFFATTVGMIESFSVSAKLGDNALMSSFVEYESDEEAVFNLFARGNGTVTSPYIIENSTQFKNIAYRMSKPSYLSNYVQGGQERSEENKFYFTLGNNIGVEGDELNFNGILFKGTFEGYLSGSNQKYTITYTSNYTSSTASLTTNPIRVDVGRITSTSTTNNAEFAQGLGLFERIDSSATIISLKVAPNFNSMVTIDSNILVSGLAILNNGTISEIDVEGLSSNLVVRTVNSGRIGSYSGLVGINNGTISSSALTKEIYLEDTKDGTAQSQYFFVGGLVYTNYGSIMLSRIQANVTLNISSTSGTRHQIAGITVTSSGGNSVLQNNEIEENAKISFVAGQGNMDVVYIAGIACYSTTPPNNSTGNVAPTGCVVVPTTGGTITANDSIIP